LLAKTYSIDGAWLPFWGVLVVAIIVTAIAARTEPLLEEARARGDTGLDALPPLAREVLERLPDPLMLIDETGRMMLVNRAMRGVIGVDAERRQPVSALVRTPSVLDAIRKTSETGETISIEFNLPVPIQR